MKVITILTGLLIISSFHLFPYNNTPIINSDGTVTFYLECPDTDQVFLRGSFVPPKKQLKTPAGTFNMNGKVAMKRDGNSWIYTTDSLPSEFYTYCFEIDGESFIDPQNNNIVRDISDNLNYFVIGNGMAKDYLEKDIPHGKINQVWYPSRLKDMGQRRLTIYLPSEYDGNHKRYPVLYLLHGSGGDEEAWNNCGRIQQILDNLIYEKRCEPMIVVMPNGNAELRSAPGTDPDNPQKKPSSINTESMVGEIESVFMEDIVNYIDSNYRTINTKEARAIAGLSLGGLHTLFIAANNPDSFDYVGLFSAQTTNGLNNATIESIKKIGEVWNELTDFLPILKEIGIDEKISTYSSETLDVYGDLDNKLKRQFQTPPQLYYIALGKDDFVKKLNDDLRKKLDKGGFPYYYHETDGGHTWENWRKYIVDFLPRIFIE